MKLMNKIIVGLIIIGLAFVMVGFGLNDANQIVDMYDKGDTLFSINTGKTKTFDEEFKAIKNLDIDVSTYQLTIKEHSEDTILIKGRGKTSLSFDKKGDTLEISESEHFSFFDFGIGFNFGKKYNMTVYIPKGMQFNNVDLDVNTGSIKIEAKLHANKVEMDVDAGEIYVTNLVCNEVEFDVAAGKIEIEELDSQNSSFSVAAGKIDAQLVGTESDYSYVAKCNVGNLDIGGYSAHGISTKDSGGHGPRYIEADCDVGSITIDMKRG